MPATVVVYRRKTEQYGTRCMWDNKTVVVQKARPKGLSGDSTINPMLSGFLKSLVNII